MNKAPLSDLQFRLLNDFQRNFPLVPQPYAELAQRLGVNQDAVLTELMALLHSGAISRVGAVFRPNVVGVSALAALSVPDDRLEDVAHAVSRLDAVNHNYQREHRYNLWFVVTAASASLLEETFQAIEQTCACGPALVLPLLEQFHIDLGFSLVANASPYFQHGAQAADDVCSVDLNTSERQFMALLQQGLPFVPNPYADLGWAESAAINLLKRWVASGVIKRMGVVVRHQELGYKANAMVVWNVPDSEVSALGRAIAASGRVSLCYRRPRLLPAWPFNLFCMIHGKDRTEVELRIAALAEACALEDYPREILFSTRRFKQCGARYVATASPTSELVHGHH